MAAAQDVRPTAGVKASAERAQGAGVEASADSSAAPFAQTLESSVSVAAERENLQRGAASRENAAVASTERKVKLFRHDWYKPCWADSSCEKSLPIAPKATLRG
ncbi:hypothetical protein Poly24_28580 [Rosistilla carotiformis]|uniref:Uncharacterized protein n=1 Tax=Rosistilla carotiformis TaxID=2528017 RepID=A0A518JUC7_9BACT|nr:hypothetical protein Poly24_28580 [Rosistilla carotiformis]